MRKSKAILISIMLVAASFLGANASAMVFYNQLQQDHPGSGYPMLDFQAWSWIKVLGVKVYWKCFDSGVVTPGDTSTYASPSGPCAKVNTRDIDVTLYAWNGDQRNLNTGTIDQHGYVTCTGNDSTDTSATCHFYQ